MSCHHCEMMNTYYSARQAQEERAEQYGAGYETVEPKVNFKDFLMQGTRWRNG